MYGDQSVEFVCGSWGLQQMVRMDMFVICGAREEV